MLDPYTLGETLRLERQTTRRAAGEGDQMAGAPAAQHRRQRPGGMRRRLARALLALADRLDPRAVVNVPHVPARPALNGTLHHA